MAAKKSKKIQVQMTHKPGKLGYKMELIRKTMTLPIEDIIAYAKESGVFLTKKYIYTTRWQVKHPRATKKSSKKKSTRNPGTTIIKGASPVVEAKKAIQRATPAKASNGTPGVSEKAMALLILRLGTIKVREMIDQTEATFHQNLGV